MHMSNYLGVRPDDSTMATRESGGVGMNHLTVVPENLETELAAEEEGPTGGSSAAERPSGADDDAA